MLPCVGKNVTWLSLVFTCSVWLVQGSLMASGQETQLQQLQLLQQQLMMHTEMMSSKAQQTPPVIDNNLLAQIKLLTDQLLSKTDTPAASSAPTLAPATAPAPAPGPAPTPATAPASAPAPPPAPGPALPPALLFAPPPQTVVAPSVPSNDPMMGRGSRDMQTAPEIMMGSGPGARNSHNMPEGAVGGEPRDAQKAAEPGFNKVSSRLYTYAKVWEAETYFDASLAKS